MSMDKFLSHLRKEAPILALTAVAWGIFILSCWLLAQFISWIGVAVLFSGLYLYLTSETPVSADDERKRQKYSVVIVGAGFSGICMGIKLKLAKIPFVILEKSETFGGTWWDNKYPGCACDVMSHMYSLSFFPNPFWSKTFPSQPEVLRYLRRVAQDYGLREFTRFNKRVDTSTFDESTQEWSVLTTDGEVFRGNFLVSGIGPLHVPKTPAFPGAEEFQGEAFHTAEWMSEFDWTEKAIGVIGTGASAVQVVPALEPKVKSLHVFQRTAVWTSPRFDFSYPSIVQNIFAVFPFIMKLHRWYIFFRHELGFFMIFTKDSFMSKKVRQIVKGAMQSEIRDPVLKKKLIPDFDLGCKRITVSNNYVQTFNSPKVTLVTQPINRICKEGVVIKEGDDTKTVPLDAIIYATGFDVLASCKNMKMVGKGGSVLNELWGEKPNAYLAITCPGFPNLFHLLGPNSGLGHNSVVWMIECQVDYIMDAILKCINGGFKSIDVREEVNENYQRSLRYRMKFRVFYSGCKSWYQNSEGFIFALWPSHLLHYWWITRKMNTNDYKMI